MRDPDASPAGSGRPLSPDEVARLVDGLQILTADQVDYDALPDAVLAGLALAPEPFIATSALHTLSGRRSPLAAGTARRLLAGGQADRWLLASAVDVLYGAEPHAARAWMEAHAASCHPYVLSEMLEIGAWSVVDPADDGDRAWIAAVLRRLDAGGDADLPADAVAAFRARVSPPPPSA